MSVSNHRFLKQTPIFEVTLKFIYKSIWIIKYGNNFFEIYYPNFQADRAVKRDKYFYSKNRGKNIVYFASAPD